MRAVLAATASVLVLAPFQGLSLGVAPEAGPAGAAESFAWIYAGSSVEPDPASRQPFPVMLKLVGDGRAVDFVSFAERYVCPGGAGYTDRIVLTDMPIRSDGTWGKTKTFPGGVKVALAGKLTAISGRVEVTSRASQGCRARTSYELERNRETYGGEASNGYPVSIGLTPRRRAIAELVLFLQARCRAPGGGTVDYRAPARLGGIPLRDGRFARTGAFRYRYRSGTLVSVVWALKGAVGPQAATGGLSFTASARYRDGQKAFDRCRGSLTWRAASA